MRHFDLLCPLPKRGNVASRMSMLTPVETRALFPAANRWRGLRPLTNCSECPIRPASICSVLSSCELSEFEGMGRGASFAPRSAIFMEGDPADAVYNVTSGLVRLFRLLPNGRRQIVGFRLPGDFLGLPSGERYGYSADAAVRTTACRFPRQSFVAFAESHGFFLGRLHDAAARALDLAHDQMMQLGPRRADAKIAAFILSMRDRWAHINEAGALVPLQMGRQDIGDYLGLSIATVSRTLTRLDRQRLILIVAKGVRILDLSRLEALAAD